MVPYFFFFVSVLIKIQLRRWRLWYFWHKFMECKIVNCLHLRVVKNTYKLYNWFFFTFNTLYILSIWYDVFDKKFYNLNTPIVKYLRKGTSSVLQESQRPRSWVWLSRELIFRFNNVCFVVAATWWNGMKRYRDRK